MTHDPKEQFTIATSPALIRHKARRTALRAVTNSLLATVGFYGVFLSTGGVAVAQSTADPAVQACRATGLIALQQQSGDITDLIVDMDSLAVSSADAKVEDVPVRMVMIGEAYIKRTKKVATEKTGAPNRFLCLIGDKGKVLLTFFTAK